MISGNEGFGGYLSVDGNKSVPVRHDMTYELSPGRHHLELSSTSDAAKTNAKGQAFLYNNTKSSGAILDAIERHQIAKQMGETWTLDLVVADGEMVRIEVLSNGSKLVGAPMSDIVELTPEQIAELEQEFEEWRNTPIRAPKRIVWGIILACLGAFGVANAANMGMAQEEIWAGIAVFGGLIGGGALLFLNGIKKKVRRK